MAKTITADDLIAVLEKALDAEAQLPTPESAGFAPNAIRDFLAFVQSHGGVDVPVAGGGNEPVHYSSLMGGLVMGAVAARKTLRTEYEGEIERLKEQAKGVFRNAQTQLGECGDALREAGRSALSERARAEKAEAEVEKLRGQG